jgi:hypothetical protein
MYVVCPIFVLYSHHMISGNTINFINCIHILKVNVFFWDITPRNSYVSIFTVEE